MPKSVSPKRSTRAHTSAVEKIAFITRHGERVSDPTNTRSVNRKYNELKRVPWHLERAATKQQREEMSERGFRTTKKGVIIDGPRNTKREPIPGAKMSIQKGGVVKWQVKDRSDYIYGMTKKEKKQFAKDPTGFIREIRERLAKTTPNLRGKRKVQVRLQWGAYQATKDFSPNLFAKRYPNFEELLKSRVKQSPAKQKADALVGIHFTVHTKGKRRVKKSKAKSKTKSKRKSKRR